MAAQLADTFASLVKGARAGAAWRLATDLAAVGSGEAPGGDPGEFLAFCGTLAAATFAADLSRRPAVWEVVRSAAEDERWRLREAAAQAIQRAAALDRHGTMEMLDGWAAAGTWPLCRAVVAGVAHPPLLRERSFAICALSLHETVLVRFVAAADRRDPGFGVLRRGLGYTLSVVVAAAPETGFTLLRRLAGVPDRDLARVLRSNLGKGRLTRAHAEEAAMVAAILDAGGAG